jgi:hypothetical protein
MPAASRRRLSADNNVDRHQQLALARDRRYPPQVITAFMQGCTQGKQDRENLCACVIDKLSYTISNRDFARVRAGRAVPRVKEATKRATATCA